MYKYELHMHTKEGSACGRYSAREMVHAYHEAGFQGMVITDHFIYGNTSVPSNLDWESRMKLYYDAYLEAKEEAKELDFDVFFGIEHKYTSKGKEILIYGIDLDFLLSHPELETADLETYAKLVHDAGGILVHAHPYRKRDYIDESVGPRYDVCDGIEVYNAHDNTETNEKARKDAICMGKFCLSGGDFHGVKGVGAAGMAFETRIKTNQELIDAIRQGKGKLIIKGNVTD